MSIADLLARPIPIGPEEASALIRRLCVRATGLSASTIDQVTDPLGPEHVWLDSSGSVHLAPGVWPTVRDLAGLLEQLLAEIRSRGVGRIPPGLLITTARAAGRIDDAPLVSAGALAHALERFDPPDADAALRALFEAVAEIREAQPSAEPAPVVRKQTTTRRVAVAATGMLGLAAGVMVAVMLQPGTHDPRPTDTTEVAVEPLSRSPIVTPGKKERPIKGAPIVPPMRTSARRPPESTPAPLVKPAAADADAAFSPSFVATGTAVFFHAQNGNSSALKRAERDQTGELHVVTIVDDAAKNYHVQLSPDGKSVAFDSDRDGVRGVYLADANGARVRRVSGSGYAAVPTWSPDGSRLAFLRAEDDKPRVWNLWVNYLASGAMTRLTSHAYGQVWGGSWFPDGRRIAYSHEDRLVVLDLNSGQSKTHASPRTGHLVRTPAVSPDGRWIMFQVFRDGAWLLDLTTGFMQRALDDPSAEEFTWAPDGRRVAFHSRRNGEWGLWVMAAR